jgi:putative transcriptional regulator
MIVKSMLAIRLAERKMKISELSRRSGVNRTTLTRMYNDQMDRVDLLILAKLCNILNCSVGDILHFEKFNSTRPSEISAIAVLDPIP